MCLKDEASDAICTERTWLVLTDAVAEIYIKFVQHDHGRGGGEGTVFPHTWMMEASGATCTERTWLVLTDVVAAKVLARLSSNASTASLLSFRFTMSSSGTGTNGSSVSATTCRSRFVYFALCSDGTAFSAVYVSTASILK